VAEIIDYRLKEKDMSHFEKKVFKKYNGLMSIIEEDRRREDERRKSSWK